MSIPTGAARRTVLENLSKSMDEESTAARHYRARAKIAEKAGDTVTARLYRHIADEETWHWHEYRQRRSQIAKSR